MLWFIYLLQIIYRYPNLYDRKTLKLNDLFIFNTCEAHIYIYIYI